MPNESESIFPLTVAGLTLTGWDGFSYVDELGRTYWSGAESPSEADALDVLANPAARQLGRCREELRLRAKERRREVEAAGVIVDGAPLETDRATTGDLTKTLMLGSIVGETFAVDWKFADGVFRYRTLAQLRVMALAAGAYVQTCFSRESQLLAAIDAAETAEQLDAVAAEIEAFALPSA